MQGIESNQEMAQIVPNVIFTQKCSVIAVTQPLTVSSSMKQHETWHGLELNVCGR
jgi:hypothetical protein